MSIDDEAWFDETDDEKWVVRSKIQMEKFADEFIQGASNVCFQDDDIAHFFAVAWLEGDEIARTKAKDLGFQDIEFYAYLGMIDEFCEELIEMENEQDFD